MFEGTHLLRVDIQILGENRSGLSCVAVLSIHRYHHRCRRNCINRTTGRVEVKAVEDWNAVNKLVQHTGFPMGMGHWWGGAARSKVAVAVQYSRILCDTSRLRHLSIQWLNCSKVGAGTLHVLPSFSLPSTSFPSILFPILPLPSLSLPSLPIEV